MRRPFDNADDEQAHAVMTGLAGLRLCPECHNAMNPFEAWIDGRFESRWRCDTDTCKFCCASQDGTSCQRMKYGHK